MNIKIELTEEKKIWCFLCGPRSYSLLDTDEKKEEHLKYCHIVNSSDLIQHWIKTGFDMV